MKKRHLLKRLLDSEIKVLFLKNLDTHDALLVTYTSG